MSFNSTYKIPKDASYVTLRNQNRMIYANYVIQQNNVQQGCQVRAELQNGGVADADIVPKLVEGALETTSAERDLVISSTACPVTTVPIVIVLRLLILGDSTVDTVKSALQTRFSELGYTNTITITTRQLSTTETGSDLTTSNYDVLLMYTSTGNTGAAALTDAIASFIDAGGNFVNTANFFGTLYPANFFPGKLSYSAFNSVGFNSTNSSSMYVVVESAITNGVGLALTNGVAVGGSGNPAVVAGGTKLATSGLGGNSLLAIGTKGSARLVSINRYIGAIDIYTNLRDLVANSVLYAKSLL